MPANGNVEKNLAGVVNELKEESKEFVSTRLAMLQAEMRDKISSWKEAAPMFIAGVLLLVTAWLLLTGALVAAIYVAFEGTAWAAFLALGIVFLVYVLFGAMAFLFAIRKWKETGVVPARTLRVLKDDQIWISNEARAQL